MALAKTDPLGPAGFAAAVRSAIDRETQWVAWKREACPPFERSPEEITLDGPPVVLFGEGPAAGVERPAKRRRGGAGTARPTFAAMIAEPVDQMAGLRANERGLMPSLQVCGGRVWT